MEGSKLWTTIIVCSRNLAQIVSFLLLKLAMLVLLIVAHTQIWIHVLSERTDPDTETGHPKSERDVTIEKKSMINLVQAVSVAIKVRISHILDGSPQCLNAVLLP